MICWIYYALKGPIYTLTNGEHYVNAMLNLTLRCGYPLVQKLMIDAISLKYLPFIRDSILEKNWTSCPANLLQFLIQ